MSIKLKISMHNPCEEKWNGMSQEVGGRFCNSCQKSVTDFTHFSDQDLITWFKDQPEGSCGRFNPEQINRLIVSKANFSIKWLKPNVIAASLIALLNIPRSGYATMLNSQQTFQGIDRKASSEILPHQRKAEETYVVVKGKIISNDDKTPITGAIIRIKGIRLTTTSDEKGNFEFKLKRIEFKKGLILDVRYIGFDTKEFKVNLNKSDLVLIEMKMDQSILGGFGLIIQKSKLHKIKDWLNV